MEAKGVLGSSFRQTFAPHGEANLGLSSGMLTPAEEQGQNQAERSFILLAEPGDVRARPSCFKSSFPFAPSPINALLFATSF